MADRCRSCQAPIIWAESTTGARIPLDEKPITGPVYTLDKDLLGETVANPVRPAPGAEVHRSHFETCPDAKDWSKS